MTPAERLARGVAALGIAVSEAVQQTLLDYLALIGKWNRVHNLTAIREIDGMVTHHLLDSLAVLPHLPGHRLLDVGTGAGLPGIVLAIVRPDWQVTLLDSNQKKTAFLRQAVIELKLANTEVLCERIENLDRPQAYDVVISRAFSALADFVTAALPVLAPGGVLAAMKGVYPRDEITQLPATVRQLRDVALIVPDLAAERHLLLLTPA